MPSTAGARAIRSRSRSATKSMSDVEFDKGKAPDFPDKDRFAGALTLTLPDILDTPPRTRVRFNNNIRPEDGQIADYSTPAFQSDGKLGYGIEHTFVVNKAADLAVSRGRHGNQLVGSLLRKDRTINVKTPGWLVPPPQATFTMMNYTKYFPDIVTHCQAGYYNVVQKNDAFYCKLTYLPAPEHSWQ
jgi:hypothetical protein